MRKTFYLHVQYSHGLPSMAASIPLGVVFPSVILFFSLTFVFYMVLLGIKNQVIAYTKLFRASLEYEDEIKLYIEELKKRV